MRFKLLLPILLIILFLLPLLFLSFKAGGYHRALGVSIFKSDQAKAAGWFDDFKVKQFMAIYLSYFSPKNLFIEGDYDQQRSVLNFSVFYSWMFPFLLMGIIQIFKTDPIRKKLFITWLLLAPLPAAATTDPFHTYRSLLLYLPLTLCIGIGLASFYNAAKRYRLFISVIICLLSFGGLLQFSYSYFVVNQITRARVWDYGYKDLVQFARDLPEDTKVVIDDPNTESYIHFLFFNKVDPGIYHKKVAEIQDVNQFYYAESREVRPTGFNSLEFRSVDWPSERGNKGTVFVMASERLPESEFVSDPNIELLKNFYYPNNEISFRVVKIK